MSVVRCPSCGRVVDGDTCFACGHSLSDAPVAPASATEAAVAINPYSTGAPPAIARAERPVTPAPGMPLAPAPPAAASKSGAVRCPHCGRIAEGTTCMACGNEWGDDVNGEVAAP